MRRVIIYFFVFILLGVGLALIFREQNGYLLVAFGPWRVETSLVFAAGALLLALWLLVGLWQLLSAGWMLPGRMRHWAQRKRAEKARDALDTGMLRLFEGRWEAAQNALLDRAERSQSPQINYLGAARAAQHRKAVRDRDQFLELAAGVRDGSELAVLLTQAELQINQGQDAEALASLARLREIDGRHPRVLELLVDLCERLRDWRYLGEILPVAAKAGVISTARWIELAVPTLDHAMAGADRDKLETLWKATPKRLRREAALVAVYARRLRYARADAAAATVIEKYMGHRLDPALALLYGELKTDDQTGQLAAVEGWLKKHGDSPELLLVAGRLCLRNKLWGRARSYFESSLQGQSRPDALLELGRLLQEIDQHDEAIRAYRKGLEMVVEERRA